VAAPSTPRRRVIAVAELVAAATMRGEVGFHPCDGRCECYRHCLTPPWWKFPPCSTAPAMRCVRVRQSLPDMGECASRNISKPPGVKYIYKASNILFTRKLIDEFQIPASQKYTQILLLQHRDRQTFDHGTHVRNKRLRRHCLQCL
jgi:hypothetical protein